MFKMGYYTTKEAANIIGVSYATILKWIRTGIFTGVVYQEDYVGHPAQMIPVEQVNLARKLRLEDGILRFKPGILEPIIEEPKVPTKEEMIKDKSGEIQRMLEDIEDRMVNLYFALEQLRGLCE